MFGSPNHLKISFIGYSATLYGQDLYDGSRQREFSFDQHVFDRFNLSVAEVRCD
jgi:hypothetical protein